MSRGASTASGEEALLLATTPGISKHAVVTTTSRTRSGPPPARKNDDPEHLIIIMEDMDGRRVRLVGINRARSDEDEEDVASLSSSLSTTQRTHDAPATRAGGQRAPPTLESSLAGTNGGSNRVWILDRDSAGAGDYIVFDDRRASTVIVTLFWLQPAWSGGVVVRRD